MTNNLGDFTKEGGVVVMGVIRRKYENIVLLLCKLLLHLCLCVWALVSLLGKLTVIFLVLENPLLICASYIFSSQVLVTCNRIKRCSYESC